jgi:Helix-turn-helix domain
MLHMKKYKQLSLEERVKMYQLRQSESSTTQIAAALKRSKSTISRELRREIPPPLGICRTRPKIWHESGANANATWTGTGNFSNSSWTICAPFSGHLSKSLRL